MTKETSGELPEAKGLCPCLVVFDDARRHADGCDVSRDIIDHDRAGPDHSPVADRSVFDDRSSCANVTAFTDAHVTSDHGARVDVDEVSDSAIVRHGGVHVQYAMPADSNPRSHDASRSDARAWANLHVPSQQGTWMDQ